jgi:hypothetical protein
MQASGPQRVPFDSRFRRSIAGLGLVLWQVELVRLLCATVVLGAAGRARVPAVLRHAGRRLVF